MPPSVFWPTPKVSSAILRIVVDPKKRERITDLRFFHQSVIALFLHRRKFLRANVVAAMKHHLDKEQVDGMLNEMAFEPNARTEELDVATLLKLADKIRSVVPNWKL